MPIKLSDIAKALTKYTQTQSWSAWLYSFCFTDTVWQAFNAFYQRLNQLHPQEAEYLSEQEVYEFVYLILEQEQRVNAILYSFRSITPGFAQEASDIQFAFALYTARLCTFDNFSRKNALTGKRAILHGYFLHFLTKYHLNTQETLDFIFQWLIKVDANYMQNFEIAIFELKEAYVLDAINLISLFITRQPHALSNVIKRLHYYHQFNADLLPFLANARLLQDMSTFITYLYDNDLLNDANVIKLCSLTLVTYNEFSKLYDTFNLSQAALDRMVDDEVNPVYKNSHLLARFSHFAKTCQSHPIETLLNSAKFTF